MSTAAWPEPTLGDIDRLHVLAAGLPGTVVFERTFDAPFERAWGWISDLERSTPSFDSDVESIEVRWRDGDRLRIVSRAPRRLGRLRMAFDVELRPGWCWMVARNGLYVIGMAAEPLEDRTRFAFLEGVNVVAPPPLRRLASPLFALSRWRQGRHMVHDLDGIARGIAESP